VWSGAAGATTSQAQPLGRLPDPYVWLRRDEVRIGAVRRAVPDARAARMPPAGVVVVHGHGRPDLLRKRVLLAD
jgi:hypothetical protein